jgi:hypothetical protein
MLKKAILKWCRAYRGVLVFAGFGIFNLVSSLIVGAGTEIGFNLKPMSITEWICDLISNIGALYAIMLSVYDLLKFQQPKYKIMLMSDEHIEELRKSIPKEDI